MRDLIEALQILLKYGNYNRPIHCEHDILTICDIDPAIVSKEDIIKLDKLGFKVWDEYGEEAFHSYKFGSC